MQIDIAKTGVENVFDLLNAANPGYSFSATNVTLAAATAAAGNAGRNTTVVATAVDGQGYTGTSTISFRRLAPNEAVASPVLSIDVHNGATVAATITALAAQLGLRDGEFQLEDPSAPGVALTTLTRPAAPATTSTVNLVALGVSYLYQGESAITLTWVDPIDLSQAITTTDMAGFDPAA